MSSWKQVLMATVGLSAGIGVAGGVFALIIALGIVSEFADQTRTARHIFWYEDAVSAGAILGNAISVYQIVLPLGQVGAGVFGLFSGVFVGAWAMALTEIVNICLLYTSSRLYHFDVHTAYQSPLNSQNTVRENLSPLFL